MTSRHRHSTVIHRRTDRRGTTLPAVVMAILTTLLAVALVLDRLWLEATAVELATAAEAAALAAARELASDDLLRGEVQGLSGNGDRHASSFDRGPQSLRRIASARKTAREIAARNLVAGHPLPLDVSPDGDLRFGRLVRNTESGLVRFLETEYDPTSVLVTARRTRGRGNPVALFFRGLTGQPDADVVARAEATLDNRTVGVRPFGGVPVPALPLAIRRHDPTGQCDETWDRQVERRQGADDFTYDPLTGRIAQQSDGLPEVVLRSRPRGGRPDEVNVQLVDLGTAFDTGRLAGQIRRGWTADDLEAFGGELRFDGGSVPVASAAAVISGDVAAGLREATGQCRIFLLYDACEPVGRVGLTRIHLSGLVAGRILAVRPQRDGSCEIVVQPAVLTTRTALLAPDGDGPAVSNRYIYKLHLTR